MIDPRQMYGAALTVQGMYRSGLEAGLGARLPDELDIFLVQGSGPMRTQVFDQLANIVQQSKTRSEEEARRIVDNAMRNFTESSKLLLSDSMFHVFITDNPTVAWTPYALKRGMYYVGSFIRGEFRSDILMTEKTEVYSINQARSLNLVSSGARDKVYAGEGVGESQRKLAELLAEKIQGCFDWSLVAGYGVSRWVLDLVGEEARCVDSQDQGMWFEFTIRHPSNTVTGSIETWLDTFSSKLGSAALGPRDAAMVNRRISLGTPYSHLCEADKYVQTTEVVRVSHDQRDRKPIRGMTWPTIRQVSQVLNLPRYVVMRASQHFGNTHVFELTSVINDVKGVSGPGPFPLMSDPETGSCHKGNPLLNWYSGVRQDGTRTTVG